MSITRNVAVALVLLALSACGSKGGARDTPTPSGPSGSLGVVTAAEASAAVRGICTMETTTTSDPDTANAIFYDEVHEELHVIAAATQVKDRVAAGNLLQAKEKVEAELLGHPLPDAFPADVKTLEEATRAALDAIGVTAPPC
jgi:hypothetical protein